jgi:predicted acetyltransferase
MNLFLREIEEKDKNELLEMIEEINNSDDYEKFEGLSNLKKVNNDNYKEFLIELEHNKNMKQYKPHLVNQSTFILVDEKNRIYGGTNIRHELNDNLLKHGGNIGYLIRPYERGNGYAKLLLKLTLEKCKLLNIKKVLVTCREENIASAKVIESNGGVYEKSLYVEDKAETYRRYWIEI